MESHNQRVFLSIALLVGTLTILVACSQQNKQTGIRPTNTTSSVSTTISSVESWYQYADDFTQSEFSVPLGFSHQTKDAEGMYFGYSDKSQLGHFTIQMYNS